MQPLRAGGPLGLFGGRVACTALPLAAAVGWLVLVGYTVLLLSLGWGLEVLIYAIIFSVPLLIFSAVVGWVVYSTGFGWGVALTVTPDGVLEWRAPLRTRRVRASEIQRVAATSWTPEIRLHHSTGVMRCSALLPGLQPLLVGLSAQQPHIEFDLASAQRYLQRRRSSRFAL